MHKQSKKTGLVWFRNDLRLYDQQSLFRASENHDRVIALYCFDPRHYAQTSYGFKKTERFRAQFLIESVQILQKNLKARLNISLLIFHEKPELQIPKLVQDYDVKAIYSQKEWTAEEFAVYKKLKSALPTVNFQSYFDQFLYHPNDIPYTFKEIPAVYTQFRKKLEKTSVVRKCFTLPRKKENANLLSTTSKIPSLQDLGLEDFKKDPRSAFPFQGGEDAARQRIDHYFCESKKLSQYKKTRNGLLGTDYSSKLSAWLANGSISARQIYWEVKKYEEKIEKNQSTYWLIFELIWRDYFKYISLKHGNAIFKLQGIKNHNLKWKNNKEVFEIWKNGQTNQDFVNANMKEIAATGFMSNRGRQNVNSFWAKELLQDWRVGAAYLESMLIDYDVHSNWGNWMYNSGVGNDPRDRKFNNKSQAERYDASGKYRQTWLQDSLFS
ncbi:DASH family cryptochrome [Haloflavibacter putidus]|uniref:Cryptochrome DASH n=1 Tax=Haloflavibacter putidus TaxID=2576776 RepID=A0A507ZPC2_9FLAO|nr:DASH family cryptochrome [Haloflavibacter putidus]TQD38847.1 DASH family cryptochrome [Haloflavibacter putidus]